MVSLILAFAFTCGTPSLVYIAIPAFFLGFGSIWLFGFKVYTHMALDFVEKYKNNDRIPSYHKELRRLNKLRAKHSRAVLGNKGWPSLRASAYEDLILVERQIAEHKGVDYEEPARSARNW